MPQGAGKKTHDAIDKNHGGKLSTGEDIVPYGNFLETESLDDALVKSFIMSAEQGNTRLARELAQQGLVEPTALRGQDNLTYTRISGRSDLAENTLDRIENRLGPPP